MFILPMMSLACSLMRLTESFLAVSSMFSTVVMAEWDDPKTLMDFYFHIPEKELRQAYDLIDWNKSIPQDVMIFEEKIVEKDEE